MSRFVLDCAIRRPVDEPTRRWFAAAQERAWASPTAGYHEGKVSSALLHEAGSTVADVLGGTAATFAPDLSAAVDLAVSSLLRGSGHRVLLTTATDAIVVQEAIADLADRFGVEHQIVGVDPGGRIDSAELAELSGHSAVLVTHAANQEIGAIQTDLGPWLESTGSELVLDASCAFGWVPVPPGWRLLIADPQAWGAPAGACAVVDSQRREPTPAFGNVPAAVVAGLSAQRWLAESSAAAAATRAQTQRICREVLHRIPDVDVRGGLPSDLPHVLSISALYVDAEALQSDLDARGFGVGSGSACASRSGHPSHVLAAVGGLTSGNVRLGLPPGLPDEAVTDFVEALVSAVAQARAAIGAP